MYSSRIPVSTDLQMLRAVGAMKFDADLGWLWAIFDDEGAQIEIDGAHVNSTSPQLIARSCDVERCGLNERGARLSTGSRSFTVRETVPDGTGMTTVILNEV